MEFLDECLVSEVMQYLDLPDLYLSVCRVNKAFSALLGSNQFANNYISTYLNTAQKFCLEKPFKLLRTLKKRNQLLRFEGIGTTGGVQEDNMLFWVGNIFYKESIGYCSRGDKDNFVCGAVLGKPYYESLSQEEKALSSQLAKVVNAHNGFLFKSRPITPDDYATECEKQTFLWLYRTYGADFFEEFTSEREPGFLDSLGNLKRFAEESACTFGSLQKSNPYTLIRDFNYQQLEGLNYTSSIAKVKIKRGTHFSCPVKTLLLMVSDTYVEPTDTNFEYRSNLTSFEAVKSEFGSNLAVSDQGNVEYVEFPRHKANLRPVLWVNFKDKFANLFKVDLEFPVGCMYVYVKMINSHNLNSEFGMDLERTNIDVLQINFLGKVLSLNASIQ